MIDLTREDNDDKVHSESTDRIWVFIRCIRQHTEQTTHEPIDLTGEDDNNKVHSESAHHIRIFTRHIGRRTEQPVPETIDLTGEDDNDEVCSESADHIRIFTRHIGKGTKETNVPQGPQNQNTRLLSIVTSNSPHPQTTLNVHAGMTTPEEEPVVSRSTRQIFVQSITLGEQQHRCRHRWKQQHRSRAEMVLAEFGTGRQIMFSRECRLPNSPTIILNNVIGKVVWQLRHSLHVVWPYVYNIWYVTRP